jgi:hypothetical protein
MLFASPQNQDVEFLRNALDKAGIQCEVRNQISLLHCHIAADDAFEMSVLSAQEQSAVRIE